MDEAFIRRAVDEADQNALRTALYQATRDPKVAAIEMELISVRGAQGTLPVPKEPYRQFLKDRAVAFLQSEAAGHTFQVPTDEDAARLIEMAEGKPIPEGGFPARASLLCFEEFQHRAFWSGARPDAADDFEVVIIGAGFSGIAMGVQLELIGVPYRILERRPEVGGVWSINRYPDARVDTQSANYQYTFEKSHPWSEYFARQGEVRDYLEMVAKKRGVYEHIMFEHDLAEARYDEKTSTWNLTVRGPEGATYDLSANVLVSAAGLFATPKKLDVDGVDDYQGELVHTTAWGADRVVAGKRVAVIGNGSTGVQLLNRVAQEAEQVYVFQRTPQWISPREHYGDPMTPELQWLTATMPYYWHWSRYVAIIPLLDSRGLLIPDDDWIAKGGHVNERSDMVRESLIGYMKMKLGDRTDLLAQLIPDYAPIARRPIVDNNWYTALTRDNVELVTTPISRITEHGVLTSDEKERPVDMIITAVGFETTKFLWPAEYFGIGGASLHELWSVDGPRAYAGMTVPDFPNFFMLYGPNAQPTSGGAMLPAWFETWSGYIAQAIVLMLEGGHSQLNVRTDIYEDYNKRLDEEASKLIYIRDVGSRDRNYYVNEWGRLQVNSPWDADYYYSVCSRPNPDDFTLS